MTNEENSGRTRTGIVALLADDDFLRVWGAGAIFSVARWLETLAVGIFLVDLTGSAATVAVVGAVRMLPMLLFGAVAGTLADRFNRRILLVAVSAAAGLCSLALGLLVLADAVTVWQIALGSFVTGILWASDLPFRRTILADIAGPARMATAMGLESAVSHVTRLLGVGLGGLLVGTVGVEGAFLLGAALYAVAIALMAAARSGEAATSGFHRSFLADTLGGLRLVGAERYLLAVLAATIVFNFFGFAYTAMVPVIGRELLLADAFAIGILSATEAAASLVVSVAYAVLSPRRRLGAAYMFSILALMGGILVFALSPSYWLSIAVMVVTGVAMGSFSVTQSILVLLASPGRLQAQAMGALAICIGLAPLGMLHLGWLAEHLGASAALAISAVEGAAAVIAVMILFPRILKPDPPAPDGGDPADHGTGNSSKTAAPGCL